jgi:hypothetical protein
VRRLLLFFLALFPFSIFSAHMHMRPLRRSLPLLSPARRLNSSVPHFAQRFAWRQLALMEAEGLSESAARERVQAEVEAAQARAAAAAAAPDAPQAPPPPGAEDWLAPPPPPRRVMAAVQAEEESVLRRVHGSAVPAAADAPPATGRRRA